MLDDMADTLKVENGVGLAAPQVGILKRLVVIDVGEGPIVMINPRIINTDGEQTVDVGDDDGISELVNPVITEASGEQLEPEGCLSCPGIYGTTKRPMTVTVRAQDRNGNTFFVSGEGLKARAFCHEIDHLNGVLFKEHVIEYLDTGSEG